MEQTDLSRNIQAFFKMPLDLLRRFKRCRWPIESRIFTIHRCFNLLS